MVIKTGYGLYLFPVRPDTVLTRCSQGKDQVQLCSLNNFDAYVVTRISKAPKSYVFAIKSTDNLSYFENKADYVHTFSCDIKEGETFVEKILLARVSTINALFI